MRTVGKRCEMRMVVRPAASVAEALEHGVLRLGVERRGRLVEHQDVRLLAHERARQRDLLPLPARQLDAVVEPAAELASRGPPASAVTTSSAPPLRRRRARCARSSSRCVDAADADVLAHVELILVEVLEDHADARAQLVRVPLAQVAPSSRMRPSVGS